MNYCFLTKWDVQVKQNWIFSSVCCAKWLQLYLTLCDPMDCSPPGSSVHGDSPGQKTEVGCHFLFQGIFPTQELNPPAPVSPTLAGSFFTTEPLPLKLRYLVLGIKHLLDFSGIFFFFSHVDSLTCSFRGDDEFLSSFC